MKITFFEKDLTSCMQYDWTVDTTLLYGLEHKRTFFVLLFEHYGQSHNKFFKSVINMHHDIDEQGFEGDPICVSTLSSHWRGPLR